MVETIKRANVFTRPERNISSQDFNVAAVRSVSPAEKMFDTTYFQLSSLGYKNLTLVDISSEAADEVNNMVYCDAAVGDYLIFKTSVEETRSLLNSSKTDLGAATLNANELSQINAAKQDSKPSFNLKRFLGLS